MDERRGWRARLIVLAIVGLALAVGATVMGGPDDTGVRLTADDDRGAEDREPAPTRPIVPAAPDDGAASRGLPIVVEPAQELRDDQEVTVSGSAFTPGIRVGVVMCKQNAGSEGGIRHCDISRVAYADVGSDGTFTTKAKVLRFIVTPADGEIDCAAGAPTCVVAAGNLSDYDESGGTAVSFEATPPPPPPTMAVIGDESLGDGDIVRVVGAGYRPGTEVTVMQCPVGDGSACVPVATASPESDGSYDIPVKLWRYLSDGIDCVDRGCVLQTGRVDGVRSASTALHFDPNRTERAAPPSARAQPTRGLREGDTITVTGTGFSPSTFVSLAICSDGEGACVPVGEGVATGDDGSVYATARAIARVEADHDRAGHPMMTADCRTTACHLLVTTMPGRTSPLRFEIEFAR